MGAQGWVCATYTKLQGKSAGPCPKIRGQHTLEGLCSPTQRQQRPAYKVSILGQNHCQHMGTSCAKKAIAICIRLAAWVITDWSAQAHPQPRATWHHTGRPNRGGPGQAHKTAEGLVMSGKKILSPRCTHTHALLRACLQQPRPGLPAYSNGARCGQPLRRLVALAVYSSLRNMRRKMPHSKSYPPQPQCMHSNIFPLEQA
jgi:hypothetical protein